MRGPGARLAPTMIVLVLVAIGASACSSGETSDQSDQSSASTASPTEPSMDFETRNERLRQAVNEYVWPDNYYPDIEEAVGAAPNDAIEGSFQSGYEYTMLSVAHVCAWSMAWLDAVSASNDTAQSEALAMLTDTVPNNPTLESMREFLVDLAAKASIGDMVSVAQYVELNCQDIPWQSAPQAIAMGLRVDAAARWNA